MPHAVIAISPWVHMIAKPSAEYFNLDRSSDIVSSAQLLQHANRYLEDPFAKANSNNPLISPIFGDFTGTCPFFIHYGGKEFMVPEIEQLIDRLHNDKVDVTVIKEPLAPHITPMLGVMFPQFATDGINAITEFILSKVRSTWFVFYTKNINACCKQPFQFFLLKIVLEPQTQADFEIFRNEWSGFKVEENIFKLW